MTPRPPPWGLHHIPARPSAPQTTGVADNTHTLGWRSEGSTGAPLSDSRTRHFKFGTLRKVVVFFFFDNLFGRERSTSGRHFLADRDELSGGCFFKRHFNASREDSVLGEVGGGIQRAWTDHSGWALSWGTAECSRSPGHREGSWPAARASTSAGPTGLRCHQEGPGPVPAFNGGSRSHHPGRCINRGS